MKTYKFIQCTGLALCLAALSGCADDGLVNQEAADQPVGIQGEPINAIVRVPGNDSRIEYDKGESALSMTWSNDDYFSVYNGTESVTTFTINEGESGKKYASFTGTPTTAYQDGDELIAVYHRNSSVTTDTDGNLRVNIQNQTGMLDEQFHYMYGTASYKTGADLSFDFRHLVSLMELNFTLPANTTLTEIQMSGDGVLPVATLIVSKQPTNLPGYLSHLDKGDVVRIWEDHWESGDYISIKGNFTSDENGQLTVYAYVIPMHHLFNDRVMEPKFVAFDTNNNRYLSTVDYEKNWDIAAGKMYRIDTPLALNIDFANEGTADGTAEKPYEIANKDQLYSLMLRASHGMCNSYGGDYRFCHYKLTSDIVLDDEMVWYPFGLYDNSFDGGGHTISGNLTLDNKNDNCGFFAGISNNYVLKNLTLDFDRVTFTGKDYRFTNFGMLVGKVENSQVINCANISDASQLTVSYNNVGGLVGYMNSNSKMIGCSFQGSLATVGYTEGYNVGGLVGVLNEGASIECSYSTGSISVPFGTEVYVGGLVGTLNKDASAETTLATITSCWTSLTSSLSNVSNGNPGDIAGYIYSESDIVSCFKVTDKPSSEDITTMNAAMTNTSYCFDANGAIMTKASE